MTPSLFERAETFRDRTAIIAPEGVFTYGNLLDVSATVATRLLAGRDDLEGARVCFLVPPSWEHIVTQWGILRAGGLSVPMAISHPSTELDYVLGDAEPEALVAHPKLLDRPIVGPSRSYRRPRSSPMDRWASCLPFCRLDRP